MHEKIRIYAVTITLAALLGVLSLWCWLSPDAEFSESERRVLAAFPALSAENIFSGKFMSEFESYALDQFPARDSFRSLQSFTKLYAFAQSDNNDLYTEDGYLAKMEYPMSTFMLDNAAEKFRFVYDTYLAETGSQVYFSIVPDKNYFLGTESGRLSIDYDALVSHMRAQTEYMQYIDIFPLLTISDYYRTDTHWRQECITDVAAALGDAMDIPLSAEYETRTLDIPFYGVYYGQLALPVKPDTLRYLTNDTLEHCIVTSYNTGLPVETSMYDMEAAAGRDPYEMFLCGADALLTVENPAAPTDRELIVFRDSFGSSLVPLLAEGYRKITVVDIRYVQSAMLGNLVEFKGQDVLFLYSTLVLNQSMGLR